MTDVLTYARPCSSSVELRDRRILVDGEPRLLLGGEVHYFRLARSRWRERLQQLTDCGCNTLATYVPWLWHELPDGSVDLTGHTHEQRDLAGFLDLATEMGLHIVVRPGPFIMAEIKNEGLPYRVYDNPGVLPTTWDGRTVTTRTADYLNPSFLEAAQGWYAQVMPVVADRLWGRGGNVVAVQLDNEIGMLSWVSNSPDLTDVVCDDARRWALQRWGLEEAARRVGADPTDPAAWAKALRSPAEGRSLTLHHSLGLYMRDRYRRYVAALRDGAERNGVTDVPFLINVHGTGGGRGRTYPIGLSQLCESWRGQPQMTAGSDLYMGDLTTQNVPDLYSANAFGAALQDADQPLTSMEFEVGADYGEDLSALTPPEATDLRTRLSLAQGNRLLNYYLFAGGHNPPLAEPVGDGNDRIAFTGERHGFAAPVSPEGQTTTAYWATQRALRTVRAVADIVADADQIYDGLALGLVTDHYLTEYAYPGSESRAEQVRDLERFRGMGPRDVLVRAMVLGGYSFPAVDLQGQDLDPATSPVVAVASPSTLSHAVQQQLANFVSAGGNLLLNGLVPMQDHDGVPCTVLSDALGIAVAGRVDGTAQFFPSVVPHGWAAPGPEVRVGYAQLLEAPAGDVVLSVVGDGRACAVSVCHGHGRALVVACDYPCDLAFWHNAFGSLDVERRWVAESDSPGLVVTPTVDRSGQGLLHLVHVGPSPVSFTLNRDGAPFLSGQELTLPPRSAVSLPVDVDVCGGSLLASTAEIVSRAPDRLVLRGTQREDVVVLDTKREVAADRGTVRRDGTRVTVTVARTSIEEELVVLTFA